MALRDLTLDDLTVDDEKSFRHVGLYAELKAALRVSGHRFQVPGAGDRASWDRALFLNLTYWSGAEETTVLCEPHIAPDVIAHTAWHHVAGRELARLRAHAVEPAGPAGPPSAAALFFGEALASAFDLYLVGRLIGNAPDSDFITTQVPVMAEAAEQAGLSEAGFASLLEGAAADPERAFEDMRALLVDATAGLFACVDATQAQAVLDRFGGHRFEPLLHHFQLSNWILHARSNAAAPSPQATAWDNVVAEVDGALRAAPVSLDWLASGWVSAPAAPA
ncbi:MAG: hypothetical protein ABUL77_02725 [Bacteroidota bacterium]